MYTTSHLWEYQQRASSVPTFLTLALLTDPLSANRVSTVTDCRELPVEVSLTVADIRAKVIVSPSKGVDRDRESCLARRCVVVAPDFVVLLPQLPVDDGTKSYGNNTDEDESGGIATIR